MTRADVAIFGEKDFQQLAVIRRMVRDLNIPINIIGEAIVRETDGLAMSSRNGYLSVLERKTAPVLYKTLLSVKQDILNGQNDFEAIEAHAKSELTQQGFKPDYLHVFQRDQLRPAVLGDKELVILVAAFLGDTRLIDNLNVNIV
jgi:pantoate--beta-alanine ligase